MRDVSFALAMLLVAGCASAVPPESQVLSPLPSAYTLFTNKPPEQGGFRSHAAVITQRHVVVYRLYDSRPSGAQPMGAYWSDFTAASEAQARDQLGVCKGWNNMARLITCTLPKGHVVLRGPGQDVNCAAIPDSGSTAYHPGGAPQLFITSAKTVLKDCTDGTPGW